MEGCEEGLCEQDLGPAAESDGDKPLSKLRNCFPGTTKSAADQYSPTWNPPNQRPGRPYLLLLMDLKSYEVSGSCSMAPAGVARERLCGRCSAHPVMS